MKTKLIFSILGLTFALCMTSTSSAQVLMNAPQTQTDDRSVLSELARVNAPIKSIQDMSTYMASQSRTPLDKLSPTGKQNFLNSLDFGEKGLTSFQYNILEAELTPTDIYAVLSLYGLQNGTPQLDGARAKTSLDRAVLQINRYKPKSTPKEDDGINAFGLPGTSGGIGGDGDNGDFLENYRCESVGTCIAAQGFACTSNC